jgi:hypothetical protein
VHSAVFLGGPIVPLPAAASRSLPAVASHAIGFAEHRPGIHSPGVGAYEENAEQPGVQPGGWTNTPEVTD